MSFSPYSYATRARHGYGAPSAGDFDQPSYLSGGDDYGMAWLAAIPLWAWATGAGTAAAGGAYLYGKSEGATAAAGAAAQAQTQAQPPSGPAPTQGYYPMQYSPGYQPGMPTGYPPGTPGYPPPAGAKITDQPWFWPAVVIGGATLFFVYTRRG
jgi:hypothetical protein